MTKQEYLKECARMYKECDNKPATARQLAYAEKKWNKAKQLGREYTPQEAVGDMMVFAINKK